MNLRAPFFSKELVQDSLGLANVLKLSDEELPILADYFQLGGGVIEQLQTLSLRFGLNYIAYTQGGEGSIIISSGEVDICPGFEVTLVDTVGAGDSFTAALTFGLLNRWPLNEVNLYANRLASYVCSQKGATPKLPPSFLTTLATR